MIKKTITTLTTDVPDKEKFDGLVPEILFSQWIESWGDSFQIQNFFSEEELEWLTDLMYKQHHSRRVKKCGTLHFFCDNTHIQDKLFDKLKKVIPSIEATGFWEGNFVLTSTPYNLHIDTGRPNITDRGLVPGKQIIIPLFVCHINKKYKDLQAIPEAGTAIFKNRFLKYGSNFAKSDEKYSTDVFYTIRDYNELDCFKKDGSIWNIDWEKGFDQDLYEKYFSHYSKKWLDGFELDDVYNWDRGSLIVFDRCQAHSGINFSSNRVTLKAGLSLMTNKIIK